MCPIIFAMLLPYVKNTMKLLNSAILEYIQYRKHYSNVLCFLIGMT
jgi:hypothetical protein